jgi:hypothetical protein
LIATYIKLWLEDSVPSDLIEGGKSSKGNYTPEKQVDAIKSVYNGLLENRKVELNNMMSNLIKELDATNQKTN